MARSSVCGFESGVLLEFPNQGTLGTAPVIETTTKRTGSYSMKATSASGLNSLIWKDYLTDPTEGAMSLAFYISTAPNAEDNIVLFERLSDFRDIIRVKLGSDRRLRITTQISGSDVQIGNYSTAVSASAWHILQLRWKCGAGNAVVYAKVDTEEFCAVTNADIGTIGNRTTYFGIGTAHTNTPILYFDDWVEDNGSGSSNAYIGDAHIVCAQPNAAGTDNTVWSTKVGSFTNNWDGVAEIPASDTNGWSETGTSAPAFGFNVESALQAGLADIDTIQSVTFKYKAKVGATQDGTIYFRVRDNGVATNTGVTLTTTSAWYELFYTLAPSDSSAWTQSRFAGVEIAMVANTSAADTFWYEGLVMIEYLIGTYTEYSKTVTGKASVKISGRTKTITGKTRVFDVPMLNTPAQNAEDVSIPVQFIWDIPGVNIPPGEGSWYGDSVGFIIQVDDTDATFSSIEAELNTWQDSGFEWLHPSSGWITYPVSGVDNSLYYGEPSHLNQVRVSINLTGGTKYWRVLCYSMAYLG